MFADWFSQLFGPSRRRSAGIAKRRLQIVISQQHNPATRPPRAPDYLPALQRELQLVVAKHAGIEPREVAIRFAHPRQACDALEVRIELPQAAHAA